MKQRKQEAWRREKYHQHHHHLYCTVLNRPIIGVIRPERVRWAGRIVRTGEGGTHHNCLYCCNRKTSSGRKDFGDQSVDGVIILRGIAIKISFLKTEEVMGGGGKTGVRLKLNRCERS